MIKGRTILVFLAAMLALPLLAQTSTTSPVSLAPPVEPQSQSTTGASTPPASPAKQAQGRPLTADDVNAWLDGFFPYAIGKANIPGAVVVVVKDGAVLTQRGFGLADVARRRPVDPRRTLFRPGSISKLFTWTAVMQQVEQGRLNLDEDVNRYLDFRIPAYQGKPVTLRNIMTHTAGFEEQAKGIITTKREDYKGFESLLKQWVPERVYPAGSTPAYSNYATSLAGYIVQRVSGQPFDDYLDRNIFGPLGMSRSTFRQPLPANLRPLMSEGYRHGKKEPYGFEFVGASPAGSLSATGEDMGRFMIAH
ncbi:MAG TPA: serine hydrolase domain-containing protein, partial [Vicinamibacterales bacterium]|nr:serine hydrolase domain-containing protein [Vicinamibacterales bacterium]